MKTSREILAKYRINPVTQNYNFLLPLTITFYSCFHFLSALSWNSPFLKHPNILNVKLSGALDSPRLACSSCPLPLNHVHYSFAALRCRRLRSMVSQFPIGSLVCTSISRKSLWKCSGIWSSTHRPQLTTRNISIFHVHGSTMRHSPSSRHGSLHSIPCLLVGWT